MVMSVFKGLTPHAPPSDLRWAQTEEEVCLLDDASQVIKEYLYEFADGFWVPSPIDLDYLDVAGLSGVPAESTRCHFLPFGLSCET